MGLADAFGSIFGGPSKNDILYEELVDFDKAKKAHGKKDNRELADIFYYYSTIFLAFGRKKEFLEAIDHLHEINPSPWILEHKKLADQLPLKNEQYPNAFYNLKLVLNPLLKEMGKITVTGNAKVYPDRERENLTAEAQPSQTKYKKYCKEFATKLHEKLKENGITLNKETTIALTNYLLDNPIETHNAISQIGTILRTNKLFEITAWYYELLEKTKAIQKNPRNTNDVMETTRNILGISYYFLATGHLDKFKEALQAVEEGSNEYKKHKENPKNPEWIRDYYALATEPTVNVYEWLHHYLQQVMFKKKIYHKGLDGVINAITEKLDDAIGSETPLHTSKQYKDCFPYIKKHAKELYLDEGLDKEEAEKYAELLTKYLLDYPMKAYDEINIVELVKAGESWKLKQMK